MGGRCWNLPTWDNYAFCVEERIPPSFLEAIFVKECFLFIFYSVSGSNYPATEFPACKSEAIHVLGWLQNVTQQINKSMSSVFMHKMEVPPRLQQVRWFFSSKKEVEHGGTKSGSSWQFQYLVEDQAQPERGFITFHVVESLESGTVRVGGQCLVVGSFNPFFGLQ